MICEIHLIIFSPLQNYGGGRETWLNLFLPEFIRQTEGRIKVTVHHFKDAETDTDRLIDVCYTHPECFHAISIPTGGGVIRNLSRVLKFNYGVFRSAKKKDAGTGLILGIGSFYEAVVPYLFSLPVLRSGKRSGVWLRSILERQLGALKGSFYTSILVALERFLLKRMNFVIANGWDTAKHYKEASNLESTVIPNAVDLGKFECIPAIGSSKDFIRISYIGRLSPEKGFKVFLDSIQSFNDRYGTVSDQVRFEVVGAGPLLGELDQVRYSNLSYKGVLANDGIPSYLSAIDCGVALTSSSKVGGGGVSHGFLELLASGRIVIAADSFIYRQVADSDSVLYVNEDDPVSLADAYAGILSDAQGHVRMAERGRAVSSRFSIKAHVGRFIETVIKSS